MQLPSLKNRDPDSHKGEFGRILLVGGARGMTGAIALAGIGAVNSGAGLVTLAVPNRCLETVAGHCLSYMTIPLADDEKGRISSNAESELLELATKATSIGIGPGMSQCKGVTRIVCSLYQQFEGPMVVDADALNALASIPDGLSGSVGPRVLTPHVGEFRRLADDETLTPEACRAHAVDLAAKHKLVLVFKGNRTLVTNGHVNFENSTGNPGMATGGSGDVLTGVLAALLGQGYAPMDAAALGVHVHGLAGDLGRDRFGEVSLSAENIASSLPGAFQQLSKN